MRRAPKDLKDILRDFVQKEKTEFASFPDTKLRRRGEIELYTPNDDDDYLIVNTRHGWKIIPLLDVVGAENEVIQAGPSGAPGWWDMNSLQTSRDFWTATQNTITITGSSTTVTPSETLTVPSGADGIPADTTLDCVHILLKWRQVEDTSGSDNAINNASMAVQIDDDSDTGWLTAYEFTNGDLVVDVDTFSISGGDMREGITDIKSRVDGADVYDIQIINAQAAGSNLVLRDFQWGLRIWWH